MKINISGNQKFSGEGNVEKEQKTKNFFQSEEKPGYMEKKVEGKFEFKKESGLFKKNTAFLNNENKENSQPLVKKIVDWVVKFCIYATIFFLPLFFLPVVPSVLELNKQFLLVILVGLGFLAWVGKMAWENQIKFRKSFILIPVIIFLGILALNTIFSVYRENSLWGAVGEESQSFISILFFAALFILVLNNFKNKKDAFKLVFIILISGFLVCLYGILQIWGKYILPNPVFESNFFNSIGSVYVFETYIAALFLLCVALFLEDINKILKIFIIVLSFFFFFVLLVINLKIVWIALLLALALILGASTVKSGSKSSQARVLPMIFLVLVLMAVLINKPIVGKKQMPVEVYLNYKTSVKLMLKSWKENALLGNGLGNYSLMYQKNRPDNLGQFWSINFNNGGSYFLTLASTSGFLGTLAFLFLVGAGLVYLFRGIVLAVFKKKESNFMIVGVGAVWFFLTIISFLSFTSMSIWMLWWVSFALFISFIYFESEDKGIQEFVAASKNPRSSFGLSFSFVLIIIGLIVAIYTQSQKYIASVYFYDALSANNRGEELEKIGEKIGKALSANPSRDNYYRNMAVTLFALANKRVQEKGQDLSPDDSNYVSQMISESLKSADQATQLSGKDPQNYVALAQIYEGVLITMEKADEMAIENYKKAMEYDPRNPALYLAISNIYITLSDVEVSRQQQQQQQQQKSAELPQKSKEYLALARENVEKALQIKNDYVEANLLLPAIYEKEGNMDKAVEIEKGNKEKYPNDPGIDFRLGLLYYKQEKWEEAKNNFLNAVKLDKNYANARYFLAITYDKQDKTKEALEQLEEVLKTNQDNEDLKKIINNLKNGKEMFDGLENANDQAPLESQTESTTNESNINPGVENQNIPESAVPNLEESAQPQEENREEEKPVENPKPEEEKN